MKFKKFLVGLAIFIVSIIFMVFANKAVNPQPAYPDCSYSAVPDYNNNYDDNYYNSDSDATYKLCNGKYNQDLKNYKEKAFLIITVLSILAILAGVLVRTVAPVSWGLVMSGLVMVLYIFADNFDQVGKPFRAIISGVALVVLIWLAYAKLGDKQRIDGQMPAPKPPQPPIPPVAPSTPAS